MNSILLTVVVLGCVLSASALTCYFPNSDKGDGGVLYPDGTYIPGSVWVFVDVAENVRQFTHPDGQGVLDTWVDASNRFNTYMESEDLLSAYAMLYQACGTFQSIVPYIVGNEALKAYFARVYTEFKSLLDAGNIPDINSYMIGAFPQFKANIGC